MTNLAERLLRSRLLLPALLVLGASIAVSRGQDAAWDLKNYHLYNAWAFLHQRLGLDLAAAGLQSFFNPLLDVPYFWLGTGPLQHAPRLLAALQGLWYGGLVYVLCRIALRMSDFEGRPAGWPDFAAIAIGATGTMTLTQAGTSTNELPLALLVLAAYLTALPLLRSAEGRRAGAARAITAGLLTGVAAGLKPTAIVYAPALALALWAASGLTWRGLLLAATLGLASLIGFIAAYGPWAVELWRLTGNPIFPMFNQVFQSPWMPASSGTDRQFMPRSPLQAVFYPFWWLTRNSTQGGNTFADARYALAMLAILAGGAAVLLRKAPSRLAPHARFLLVFVATSYIAWLALYSILRYAVPIEALTGLVVLAVVRWLAPRPRMVGAAMAFACVLMLGTTRYTDWGHAPFASRTFDIQAPPLPKDSMVAILSGPTAYVAPFLPGADGARFVGITWLNAVGAGYELDRRVQDALRGHRGPVYALMRDSSAPELAMLEAALPGATLTDCRRVLSNLEQTRRRRDLSENLRLCMVRRPAG